MVRSTKLFSYSICVFLLGWQCTALAGTPKGLRFGVHPYLPAEEIKRNFMPLVAYLSDELKMPVSLQVSKDYESHVILTGNNSLDISYLGPSSYVSLTQRYGKRPILGRLAVRGKPFFHGIIITAANSNILSLKDINGRRFAFTSPRSTMGYLVPRHLLAKAGIKLEQLGKQKFLGNHKNVALSVLVGDFDAGAVKEEVFEKYQKKGLRKLAQSEPISEHIFVCRKKLPARQVKRLREALYKLNKTAAGLLVLQSIKSTVTGIMPGEDKDYDTLRQIMRM